MFSMCQGDSSHDRVRVCYKLSPLYFLMPKFCKILNIKYKINGNTNNAIISLSLVFPVIIPVGTALNINAGII